jgi:hypothetical protein
VEAAGAGAEIERALPAIPETGAAMDALFAIECGHGGVTAGDGLAGTHLDAELFGAGFAEGGVGEVDVVVEAAGGLDFAA